jgi:hypothetical protein
MLLFTNALLLLAVPRYAKQSFPWP